MVGRHTTRAAAIGRYLDALPSSSNNNNNGHMNHTSARGESPLPYTVEMLGKNLSHDKELDTSLPLTTIEPMHHEADDIHVMSDVTSDSDVSDDDQTMSLLSREERVKHSQRISLSPPVVRTKSFTSRYNQPDEKPKFTSSRTSQGPSAVKWKEALRLHSKSKAPSYRSYSQAQQTQNLPTEDEEDPMNTGETMDTGDNQDRMKISTPYTDLSRNSAPNSWKQALRKKSSQREQERIGVRLQNNIFHSDVGSHQEIGEVEKLGNNDNDKSEGYQDHGSTATIPISTSPNVSCESGQPTVLKWGQQGQQTNKFIKKNKKDTLPIGNDYDPINTSVGETSNSTAMLSVKDRILKFGGKGNNASGDTQATSLTPTSGTFKPKLKIKTKEYRIFDKTPSQLHSNPNSPRRHNDGNDRKESLSFDNNYKEREVSFEDDDDDIPLAPSPSRIPPSPLAAAAANAAAELVRRSMHSIPTSRNKQGLINSKEVNKAEEANNSRSNTSPKISGIMRGNRNFNTSGDDHIPKNNSGALRSTNHNKDQNLFMNAKSKLRSRSVPRTQSPSNNNQATPSQSQSPFRFDIPDDQIRTSNSNNSNLNHFAKVAQQSLLKTRRAATMIEQETNDILYRTSSKLKNNLIASKKSNTNIPQRDTVFSKEEMENLMDRKLQVMEDRLKAEINERMENLESNMERKMDEIHGLLLNLFDKRIHDRGSQRM